MLTAASRRAVPGHAVSRWAVARWARRASAAVLALAMALGYAALASGPAQADDVRNAQMWVLDALSAPSAWPVTEGQGVTVAVIDSGVNPDVSDLTGSVITGPDLTGVHTPRSNPFWGTHGTWMASLIAGHGHDGGGSGIMGVAPRSKVLSIRVVTDKRDPGYNKYQRQSDNRVQQSLARAIRYAANHRAGVISMSLGYGAPSAVVRSALQYALDHGIVVVASSGNSGNSVGARTRGQAPYSFPADYPGVLGVAAVSQSGSTADFSSDNLSVQVAAPGVDVPAQGRDGQYWLVSGTSPACALTAGVAALIKSKYPHLTPAMVVRAITASTQNRPPGGYDDKVGFGTVDASAALTAAASLSRVAHRRPGVAAAVNFGGGSAAVPPIPVHPRGGRPLLVFCLLAFACLALAAMSGSWLRAARRTRRAADSEPAAGYAGPAWPGGPPHPGDQDTSWKPWPDLGQ